MRRCLPFILLCLLAACATADLPPQVTARPTIPAPTAGAAEALTAEPTAEATAVAASPDATSVPETTPETTAPSAAADDRLLVWLGSGVSPAQPNRDQPGQLALLSRDGQLAPLLDLPARAARVTTCGESALSPDSRHLALFAGADDGTLYLMTDGQPPREVRAVDYLTCLGWATFDYAPDSARFGYIAYPTGAASRPFASGTLHIQQTDDLADVWSAEDVAAFDLLDDGAAYVALLTDDQGLADEAVVFWWDGAAERELAAILPPDDCRFTSAAVQAAAANLALLLGQRCAAGAVEHTWNLYRVDPDARTAALIGSDTQPGIFAAFARTNNLIFSPDAQLLYFTVPDALTANTVALASVDLASGDVSVPVERQMIFPTYSGAPQALPRRSPDGLWLAGVVTSPNNDNTLTALNLADPATPPITVGAGSRGDSITALEFTPDGAELVYIAGATGGASNSLYRLPLTTGIEQRVLRGRFAPGLVVSPAGDTVALLDWQPADAPNQPDDLNLVLVDLATGAQSTLYEGADQRFAAPLAWLPVPDPPA